MSYTLSLLNDMRGRLGIFLGTPSITRLAAFLRGYDYAVEKIGQREPDAFLSSFRDWIHRRFATTKQSWEETILLHSANEADAIRQFWELLDEYLREQSEASPCPVGSIRVDLVATPGLPDSSPR